MVPPVENIPKQMENEQLKQKRIRPVSLLAAILGLSTIALVGAVNRELTAHFGSSSINILLSLSYLLLWSAIGYYGLKRVKSSKLLQLVSGILLPVTTICGTVTCFIIPNFTNLPTTYGRLLTAGAGTLLFGLIAGLTYRLCTGEKNLFRIQISWLLGAIFWSFAYFFLQDSQLPELLLLLPALLFLYLFLFTQYQLRSSIVTLLFVIIMAIVYQWLGEQQIQLKKALIRCGKNRQYLFNTVEAIDGRYSRRRPLHYQPGKFAILKNSHVLWQLPRDYYRYNQITLISILQNSDRDKQNVMIIANPFTKIPYLLQDIPLIENIDMLCEKLLFCDWAIEYGLTPELSSHFHILLNHPDMCPIDWQDIDLGQQEKYDLIIVLDNIASLPFNQLFFQHLKDGLKPNGVITVGLTRPASRATFIVKQLSNLFPVVKQFSTPDLLILLTGNGPITASPQLLDKRLSNSNDMPPGFIAAMNNIKIFTKNSAQTAQKSSSHSASANNHVIAIALLCYLLLHFWMSRYHNFSALFSATENGLYTGAITLVMLNYLQVAAGTLYSIGVPMIGVELTGVLAGILLARLLPKIRIVIILLSIILPLSLIYFQVTVTLYHLPLITLLPLLFSTGLAGGSCYTLVERQSRAENISKLPVLSLGGLITALLLMYTELSVINWIVIIITIRAVTTVSVIKYGKE